MSKPQYDDMQMKVFLDRYARKNQLPAPGDLALVIDKDSPLKGRYGRLEAIDEQQVRVAIDGEEHTLPRRSIVGLTETEPAQMWDRVAGAVAEVEAGDKREEIAKRFRRALDDFKFVPGGRILAGAGLDDTEVTYYNCYVGPCPEDSRAGIMRQLESMVEIMARGGGFGFDLSSLRPRGAIVKGVNGTSSGAVSWGELFSDATGLIEQGGSRRGALMLMMHDWHPDVQEFIHVKEDLHRINNANLSVLVGDDFMEAVKNDDDWDLVFPDTSDPDYDDLWEGDMHAWREAGKEVIVYDTVRARDLWEQICTSAHASGEPGVVFYDRYNEWSNSYYFNRIVSTNPCVTGDTRVSTGQGLIPIEELTQRPFAVALDEESFEEKKGYVQPAFQTGVKPVYRLQTSEGYTLKLTADHRVYTNRGWVEAADLEPGDKIKIAATGEAFGSQGSAALGRCLGWLVGDGSHNGKETVLSFWGDDRQCVKQLTADVNAVIRETAKGRDVPVGATVTAEHDEERISSTRLLDIAAECGLVENKLQVPRQVLRGNHDMQAGFLSALFSADGRVQSYSGGNSIRLNSCSVSLLQDVQRLLLNFGVYSRLLEGQADYELAISKKSMARFAQEIGFLQESKQEELENVLAGYKRGPYRDSHWAQFTALEPLGEQPVYDLTEPLTHSFIANGLVVHNCGEQGLPAWGVCNLGAINLTKFIKPDGSVDWEELGTTVRTAVRFLDDVVDQNYYFKKENEVQQKGERRVGLGTMGLAHALIMKKLTYGSDEAGEFVDEVYQFIRDEAYRESIELAEEKGAFPQFDAEKHLESKFIQTLPEDIRDGIAEKGIRNVTLLTQAPTGSTSLLAGVSSGIEPVFRFKMRRMDRIGEHYIYDALYKEWEEAHPGEPRPDYFVQASDLSPADHVRIQAVVQRYVDSSISKTVNAPNDHSISDTAEVFELAYDLGCKGITYFRDGSRMGVLSSADEPEETDQGASEEQIPSIAWGQISPVERPQRLNGITAQQETPLGHLYLTMNVLDQHPFEMFAQIGKAGSDVAAFTEAIARLVSLAFRCGIKPQAVADELAGIGGSRSVGFGAERVRSVPDAMGKFLADYLQQLEEQQEQQAAENAGRLQQLTFDLGTSGNGHGSGNARSPLGPDGGALHETAAAILGDKASKAQSITMNLCPSCGLQTLVYAEGCSVCVSCGHSEC